MLVFSTLPRYEIFCFTSLKTNGLNRIGQMKYKRNGFEAYYENAQN